MRNSRSTVGLHMADLDQLLHVLHRLVDADNSVLVIKHKLDVIAKSDWIIDMGPEGGAWAPKRWTDLPYELPLSAFGR